uniref:Protein arginine N-methyltransferase n=1 Tax=Mycena chlorophos TaxID=658473 RepID=A0ABQ0M5D6_MYCCL|nr:protein arginine N-methyltransferase [Mycena chlorophos]
MTAANEHLAKYEEVLKDGVPTAAFSRLMIGNKHIFKDKTVLNVACGTGLLCLFAAKAGAKHVVGIDKIGFMAQARDTVAANGFKDVITLVEGRIGDTSLPFSEFDIIISDWMGKCLFYESRLEEVILARDKYLKKDGLIYPESVSLYMAAIEDSDFKEEKFGFWDNIQGLDYSAFKPVALRDPLVDTCDIRAVVTQPYGFKQFKLSDVKKEDLIFDETFALTALRDDFIHAFIVWFDVSVASTHSPVHFSTGPHTKSTRWGQTIFYTRETPAIAKDQVVTGHFVVQPNTENAHDLDIRISYKLEKKSGSEIDGDEATSGESASESLSYKMY